MKNAKKLLILALFLSLQHGTGTATMTINKEALVGNPLAYVSIAGDFNRHIINLFSEHVKRELFVDELGNPNAPAAVEAIKNGIKSFLDAIESDVIAVINDSAHPDKIQIIHTVIDRALAIVEVNINHLVSSYKIMFWQDYSADVRKGLQEEKGALLNLCTDWSQEQIKAIEESSKKNEKSSFSLFGCLKRKEKQPKAEENKVKEGIIVEEHSEKAGSDGVDSGKTADTSVEEADKPLIEAGKDGVEITSEYGVDVSERAESSSSKVYTDLSDFEMHDLKDIHVPSLDEERKIANTLLTTLLDVENPTVPVMLEKAGLTYAEIDNNLLCAMALKGKTFEKKSLTSEQVMIVLKEHAEQIDVVLKSGDEIADKLRDLRALLFLVENAVQANNETSEEIDNCVEGLRESVITGLAQHADKLVEDKASLPLIADVIAVGQLFVIPVKSVSEGWKTILGKLGINYVWHGNAWIPTTKLEKVMKVMGIDTIKKKCLAQAAQVLARFESKEVDVAADNESSLVKALQEINEKELTTLQHDILAPFTNEEVE